MKNITQKNRFLVLVVCIFIGNVSASESSPTEEDSHEVASASEMEELEELLKTIDSEEFLEAFQIAVDAMVEKSKIAGDAMVEKSKIMSDAITKAFKEFGAEAAKKWADTKKEETKSAKEVLIKYSEQFGSETVRRWEPILWALVSLYAIQTITSILNH